MTKRERMKAERIMARLGKNVEWKLNYFIKCEAKERAQKNEEKANLWGSYFSGAISILQTMDLISCNEWILLVDYGIARAYELADELDLHGTIN